VLTTPTIPHIAQSRSLWDYTISIFTSPQINNHHDNFLHSMLFQMTPSQIATNSCSQPINRVAYLVRMLALYPSLIIITTLSLAISIEKSGLFSPLAIASVLIAYTIYGFSAYKMTFLAHEAAHNSFFRNKCLNQAIGNYSCVFLFISFAAYARSHLRHHSSKTIEEDPDRNNYSWDERQDTFSTLSRADIQGIKKWLLNPLYFGRLIELVKSNFSDNSKNMPTLKGVQANQIMVPILNVLALFTIAILAVSPVASSTLDAVLLALLAIIVYTLAATSLSLFLGRIRTFFEHNIISISSLNGSKRNQAVEIKTCLRGINRPADPLSDFLFVESNFNMHYFHHKHPNSPSIYHPRFIFIDGEGGTSSSLPIIKELMLLLG